VSDIYDTGRLNAMIDSMSHEDMARMWRFAPPGHPIFNKDLPFFERFEKRFKELGGMTPAISKMIGWKGTGS